MHFRLFSIFSIYGLYFLPGSNFDPFVEVKVPVSNSAEFFGWLGLIQFVSIDIYILTFIFETF